ncbi:MAG: ATP-binding cassette domain-containing protein [Candidatus Bathyarchaeota archaeon]
MKLIQMTKPSSFSSISTAKIIQMNDVWTSYDSKNYTLKAINLSIERGTNYAVVGKSGSGKSTLLKLMNGMMNPSKGIVKVDYQTPDMNNKKFKITVLFVCCKNITDSSNSDHTQ